MATQQTLVVQEIGHANLLRDDEAALTPLENRIECYGYDYCRMTFTSTWTAKEDQGIP